MGRCRPAATDRLHSARCGRPAKCLSSVDSDFIRSNKNSDTNERDRIKMSNAPLLFFIATICMVSANGKTPVGLAEADWLSTAKAALDRTSRSGAVTFVVDDDLSPEARKALQTLGKVVSLADFPDQNAVLFPQGDYLRVLQFQAQGDRIEFLSTGNVYPKVVRANCHSTTRLLFARTADGDWKQDGPMQVSVCTRH